MKVANGFLFKLALRLFLFSLELLPDPACGQVDSSALVLDDVFVAVSEDVVLCPRLIEKPHVPLGKTGNSVLYLTLGDEVTVCHCD